MISPSYYGNGNDAEERPYQEVGEKTMTFRAEKLLIAEQLSRRVGPTPSLIHIDLGGCRSE